MAVQGKILAVQEPISIILSDCQPIILLKNLDIKCHTLQWDVQGLQAPAQVVIQPGSTS